MVYTQLFLLREVNYYEVHLIISLKHHKDKEIMLFDNRLFFTTRLFLGKTRAIAPIFPRLLGFFLDYRAILTREIYIILVSSIDILHIHVHTYFFVTP